MWIPSFSRWRVIARWLGGGGQRFGAKDKGRKKTKGKGDKGTDGMSKQRELSLRFDSSGWWKGNERVAGSEDEGDG